MLVRGWGWSCTSDPDAAANYPRPSATKEVWEKPGTNWGVSFLKIRPCGEGMVQ